MPAQPSTVVDISELADFPDRIDVRSPGEYDHDHIPGARSHPVLDNEERIRIGTLHKQDSAFAAKKAGAALVARNIAGMLETAFAGQPRTWRPLIYCWRGGKRSAALAHVLNEIGWHAVQLKGGYKTYRRHVIDELTRLPKSFSYRVICGVTGSGKSRLLLALREAGAQVLDLEGLARHRGSLLGDLPDAPQPSQKAFESLLCEQLQQFDPERIVYVESESKKVGEIRVPQNLIDAMWISGCVRVEATLEQRLQLLLEEYVHFIEDPEALHRKLGHLVALHGKEATLRWRAFSDAGDWSGLVADLLHAHYDPAYLRSMRLNYPQFDAADAVAPASMDANGFAAAATNLVRAYGT
ncbi:MAG: tRNA 2-selenouridine(34) synthase MnmH [Betaproteobacteria bacterium]